MTLPNRGRARACRPRRPRAPPGGRVARGLPEKFRRAARSACAIEGERGPRRPVEPTAIEPRRSTFFSLTIDHDCDDAKRTARNDSSCRVEATSRFTPRVAWRYPRRRRGTIRDGGRRRLEVGRAAPDHGVRGVHREPASAGVRDQPRPQGTERGQTGGFRVPRLVVPIREPILLRGAGDRRGDRVLGARSGVVRLSRVATIPRPERITAQIARSRRRHSSGDPARVFSNAPQKARWFLP